LHSCDSWYCPYMSKFMPWVLKVSSSFLWFPHRCTVVLHKNPQLSCFSYFCVFRCQHSPDLCFERECARFQLRTPFSSQLADFFQFTSLYRQCLYVFSFKVLVRELRKLVWVCIRWRNVFTCHLFTTDWSKSALQTILFYLNLHALASLVYVSAIFYLSCHYKCWIPNANMRICGITLIFSSNFMKRFDFHLFMLNHWLSVIPSQY